MNTVSEMMREGRVVYLNARIYYTIDKSYSIVRETLQREYPLLTDSYCDLVMKYMWVGTSDELTLKDYEDYKARQLNK